MKTEWKPLVLVAAMALGVGLGAAKADPARDAIIAGYAEAAGAPLDAGRGEALFLADHTGGKPETPSCTSCHTADMTAVGQTRAGKEIAPMAVSVVPDRFTDLDKVEKWFGRNCNSVLGRDCTAQEKGDILTWLASL